MTAERPIVVGVADKQHAALAYALANATKRGCELRVVHVYHVPQSTTISVYAAEVAESFEAGGQMVLADARSFVETLGPSVPVHYVLTRGHASSVLLEESAKAAELVLGPDNTSWVSLLFEGHVTRHVVSTADCPVVVVPEEWAGPGSRHGIVLAAGDEPPAEGPLLYAFETASRWNEPLRIVHITPQNTAGVENDLAWVDLSRLLEAWHRHYPQVEVERTIVFGEGPSESLRLSESSIMIVAGRPPDAHILSVFERPFAQKIIGKAGCPVVVVPPHFR